MANYISIDGGTTNTRLSLVVDEKIVTSKKYNIGAGAGEGVKSELKKTIAKGISELIEENRLSERDITAILASGMITSEYGLYLLPHITLPVGIDELKAATECVEIPEISSIPFVFMRGVKTDCESLETADMMRGEETELMGIAKPEYGKSVYALMGSHTKMIKTDADRKIIGFVTMLTGELCSATAHNTILKNSFDFEGTELDGEYLLKGFEYARKNGVGEALFKVRILKNIFSCTASQAYSFFMGIILQGDADYVMNSDAETAVIAGNKALKDGLAMILKEKCSITVVNLSEAEVENSVALGQIRIYEKQN